VQRQKYACDFGGFASGGSNPRPTVKKLLQDASKQVVKGVCRDVHGRKPKFSALFKGGNFNQA
jgi:hypothetical protein